MTRELTGRSAHSYFACFYPDSDPISFQPPEMASRSELDALYFRRVLAAMEPRLSVDGLTFYLTSSTTELPAYGKDVVAIVIGDEAARIPSYFHRVGITFKGYGIRPALGIRPSAAVSRLGVASGLDLLEKLLICAPGVGNFLRQGIRARALRPPALPGVFTIPLGYSQQLDRPIVPILERPVDVFFAGSVRHFVGGDVPLARRVVPSAKALSRKRMLEGLASARAASPDLRVDVQISRGFADPEALSPEAYSDRLMAARICLAPRGNSPDTLRVFEGMRYGCIVLSDPLPRHWFYDGAPIIQVSQWRRLPEILSRLLSDPAGLEERHRAMLSWWSDRCGEEAIGAYMADRINRYLRPPG
jgi:hypothetical protein